MTDCMYEFIIIAWFMGYLHSYMWQHMKAWYSEIKKLNSKESVWDYPRHKGASKRND